MAFSFRGTPRFRVSGARITRWARGRVPFPSVRGVKSLEEEPRIALGLAGFPFPGRRASEVGAIEPILFFLFWETKRGYCKLEKGNVLEN